MTNANFRVNGKIIPGKMYDLYTSFDMMEDVDKIEFLKLAVEALTEAPITGHDDSISRRIRKHTSIKGKHHIKKNKGKMREKTPESVIDLKRGRKDRNDGSKPGKGKKDKKDEKVGHGNLIANNDAGQVLHVENFEGIYAEALKFIHENYGKKVELSQISEIEDKLALQSIINRMMAFYKTGWEESGDVLTNGSVQADPNVWTVKEGLLVNKKSGHRASNFDWLFELRSLVAESLKSDIPSIEGMINGK